MRIDVNEHILEQFFLITDNQPTNRHMDDPQWLRCRIYTINATQVGKYWNKRVFNKKKFDQKDFPRETVFP